MEVNEMFSLVPINRARGSFGPFSIDRFFDEPFFRTFEKSASEWNPAVEVVEADNEIVFSVEVPGIDEKDLKINVEDGLLTFSGERTFDKQEGKDCVRRERWYGKFTRSFRLPRVADLSTISAELKNGVLKVTVPKKEEARPRQIEVRVS
jgi:HSP20 family protein